MAENNDGYVLHAAEGARTIVEIDESTSTFKTVDGKLTGTLEGTITKEFTGNSNKFSVNLNNIPFDGAGGGSGSGVEFMNIVTDYSEKGHMYVYSVDKTYEELCEAAASGKLIVCNVTEGTDEVAYGTATRHVVSVMISPGPTPQYGFTFVKHSVEPALRPGIKDKLLEISKTVFYWYPDMETPQVKTVYYDVAQYSEEDTQTGDDGGK